VKPQTVGRAVLTLIGLGVAGVQIFMHLRGNEVGDSCRDREASCVDADSGLFCRDGKLMAVECPGPNGCIENEQDVTCDMSQNEVGAACWNPTGTNETATCSPDKKEMVYCTDGVTRRVACLGKKGCRPNNKDILCDQAIATVGEACEKNVVACNTDGKTFLRCREGKLAEERLCRGPKGCSESSAGEVLCDDSVAELGDACDDGRFVCSGDHRSVLLCLAGKYAPYHTCRGERPCETKRNEVTCDMHLADVGDPCHGEVSACTVDGKKMLDCKEGKFAVRGPCRSCELDADASTILCK
jgi:hypothetical protein